MNGVGGHIPSVASRRTVKEMALAGATRAQISRIMEIAPKTLDSHYEKEMKLGSEFATGQVAGALYKKAIGGDVASMIFWMKTRGGWRETNRLEVTGADGENLFQGIIESRPLTALEWDKEYGDKSSLETAGGSSESAD